MKSVGFAQGIVTGLGVLLLAAGAIAGPSFRTAKFTFGNSVRVPGTILSAGTYYFKAPNTTNRVMVRIDDEDHKIVTQFMGIPDQSLKKGHDIDLFGEQDCGPKAVKSWFYPGSGLGVRFVYSPEEAALIASSCNEPVPETHDTKLSESQLQNTTVYLMTAQKQEQPYSAGALADSDKRDGNGVDAVK